MEDDSFYAGLLDHPHYTRPASWRGEKVPDVLTGGDAKAIEKWRRRQAVERTLKRRPDVVGRAGIRAAADERGLAALWIDARGYVGVSRAMRPYVAWQVSRVA